jgi:EF-hand domain-containing protein 1
VIGELADHYTWKDLNIAININFFERIFRIYDCDPFTKEFYSYMELSLNEPETLPNDLFKTFIRTKDAKINPPDTKEYKEYIEVKLGGGHPNDGLKKYLDNDRKVLSYRLLWNDATL